VEIGDRRFKNVISTDGIDGILRSRFRDDSYGAVWIYKGLIRSYVCAVERSDGIVFKIKTSSLGIVPTFLFFFIPMLISMVWLYDEGGSTPAIIAGLIWIAIAYAVRFKLFFAVIGLKADDSI